MMTTTVADPVQAIKDEETKVQKKIENFINENQEKLEEYKIKKEKDFFDIQEKLRIEGQSKLNDAKKEAMKKFKEITEEEDKKRKTIIKSAEINKSKTIEAIVTKFEKYLS